MLAKLRDLADTGLYAYITAMDMETKQCRKCTQEKPLEDFEKNRATCTTCVKKQRADAHKRTKAKKASPEPEQPTVIDEGQILSILENRKASTPSFQEREQTENFIANDLLADIERYNQLATVYQQLADTATNNRDRRDYAAKIETLTAKKVDLKIKLIKQFGFFSELAKPENDDPLYTPVHLYLNTALPERCIVDPPFEITDDLIQPVESSNDGDE